MDFSAFSKKSQEVFLPPKNGGFWGMKQKKKTSLLTRLGEVFQGVEFHVLVAVQRFVSQVKPMVTSESGGVCFVHRNNNKKTAHELKS